MRECRVWLPATVITVTPGGTTRVNVQPTLKRVFPNAPLAQLMPPLQDLPVVFPRGNTWGSKFPVAPGDAGMVIFCDRSLDVWKAQPAPLPVDPQSLQTHNLSDGVFIPGLYPLLAEIPPQLATAGPLDLAFYNGLAQLFLQPQGGFIQGNGTVETYALQGLLLTALIAAATAAETAYIAQAAGFAAQATASTGPLAGLAPGFTVLAATATALAAAQAALLVALAPVQAGLQALTGIPGE